MPYPGLLHPEPLPLWQATANPYLCSRHSNTQRQAQSLWGLLVCTEVLFEPSEHIWCVWGLILNVISPLLPSCWGFSFALGCGISPHSCSSNTQLPLQDLLEPTPPKDVLFIIGVWNTKVGSQEIPEVTGKFGLGVQNEAEVGEHEEWGTNH